MTEIGPKISLWYSLKRGAWLRDRPAFTLPKWCGFVCVCSDVFPPQLKLILEAVMNASYYDRTKGQEEVIWAVVSLEGVWYFHDLAFCLTWRVTLLITQLSESTVSVYNHCILLLEHGWVSLPLRLPCCILLHCPVLDITHPSYHCQLALHPYGFSWTVLMMANCCLLVYDLLP